MLAQQKSLKDKNDSWEEQKPADVFAVFCVIVVSATFSHKLPKLRLFRRRRQTVI